MINETIVELNGQVTDSEESYLSSTETTMGRQKSVYYCGARPVNCKSKFIHKKLCDGITITAGSACVYSCAYCYAPAINQRQPLMAKALTALDRGLHEIVVRRQNATSRLRKTLQAKKYKSKGGVVFISPLVDPAPNIELADETLEMINVIMEESEYQVRLLSKSPLLTRIAAKLKPEYRSRVIFGFSLGILDDDIGQAIETGTPLISKRLAALKELQDGGYRTFVMLCPIVPYEDAEVYVGKVMEKINLEACETVWAEILNPRGGSFKQVISNLGDKGFMEEAKKVRQITADPALREQHGRELFTALSERLPASKFLFMHYVSKKTNGWWQERVSQGALPLGKNAEEFKAISTESDSESQSEAGKPQSDADREKSATLKAGDKRLNRKYMKTSLDEKNKSSLAESIGNTDQSHKLTVLVLDDEAGEDLESLSSEEETELDACESKVRKGFQVFEEVGAALAIIHDKKLYRAKFKKFTEYCEVTFGFSRSQGIRLIEASKVVKKLKSAPNGTVFVPECEAQARALTGLSPSKMVEVAQEVKRREAEGKPTLQMVETVKEEVLGKKQKGAGDKTKIKRMTEAVDKNDQLEEIRGKWRAYVDFLDVVRGMLEAGQEHSKILHEIDVFVNESSEAASDQQEAA